MSDPKTLDELFAEPDSMGLLAVETRSQVPVVRRQLCERFQEVVAFARRHGRAPDPGAEDFEECQLGTRLQAMRAEPEHAALLQDSDPLGLLDQPPSDAPRHPALAQKAAASFDDVLASDDMGLLADGEAELFDLRHVPRHETRQTPEAIAQRRGCDDFHRFAAFFERLRDELRAGRAETVAFSRETRIREGEAFVLNGMLCLIEHIGRQSEEDGRFNPRLRVIFDNATESDLLLRSLTRALYKDDNGRRVLQDDFAENFHNISHRDRRAGTVYILRSLSERAEILSIRHLYKIGYTEHSVESRIADAPHDKTFLEAPVKVVATFECYNVDPNRFERLIHGVLARQRLGVTLRAMSGETYQPREWFTVELDTAREVVRRIIDGSIVDYRIDRTTGRIVPKTGDTNCENNEFKKTIVRE